MQDLEILRLKAQNRENWMKGVEAITGAYKQILTTREEKKPHNRYNPDYQREARGGGGRRGRGRRGRGGPPSRAPQPRGQQTITAYLRK